MIIQPPLGLTDRIQALLDCEDDAPLNPSAVNFANGWILYFYNTIVYANNLEWVDPSVSIHDGTVEIAWEVEGKTLYLYISPLNVEYEANTDTSNADGIVDSAQMARGLWDWFTNNESSAFTDPRPLTDRASRVLHRADFTDRVLSNAATVADAYRQRIDLDADGLKEAMTALADSVADLRRLFVN